MKIHVEMTAEEFQEFMQWKADKGLYGSRLEASASKYKYINSKIIWALEPDGKKPGKVKIIDQEHAAELVDMAKEYFCQEVINSESEKSKGKPAVPEAAVCL